MKDWKKEYQNWQGTAAELAQEAEKLSKSLDLREDDITPNERLVRNYVQLEILDRPVRKGKEAYFGFTQLVQFLCTRVLVSDGWPLSKIADYFRTAEVTELLELLPKESKGNKAQNLIKQFKSESGQKGESKSSSPAISHSIQRLKEQISYSEAIQSLGNESPEPERKVMTRIELTPWCHVYVDSKVIKKMTTETLDALVKAFTQSLKEERYRRGEKQ